MGWTLERGGLGGGLLLLKRMTSSSRKKGKQQFDLNGCSSTNFFLLPTDINSLIDFHR